MLVQPSHEPLSVMRRILLILGLLLASRSAAAQGPENVLLVINENSPVSVEVGEYYAKRRGLPPNRCSDSRRPATETIRRPDYDRTIELPIGAWLTSESLQDQVLYIVLTKGIPLRIAGTRGARWNSGERGFRADSSVSEDCSVHRPPCWAGHPIRIFLPTRK